MCASAHVMLAEKLDAVRGKHVGVFGLGPAGLVFVQLARAAGATRVSGFDPVPERRDLARNLGADEAFASADDFPVRGQTGCLDSAFDCVGSPAAVHQAMEVTQSLVVLFAVQREPYMFPPKCWPNFILAGTQPHTREAAEYAAARLEDGRLTLAPIVTHTMPLEDYARAVNLLRSREAVKVAFLL